MGRVQPNPDQVVTVPAMPAVTAPSEAPRSGPVAITLRPEERHSEAPLSRGAVELLRRTIPRVLRSTAELASAPLDHREGFVVSLVDGKTTVQALIDLAAMPDGELIIVLQRLRRLGIITLG
jgi:hypothetical protein